MKVTQLNINFFENYKINYLEERHHVNNYLIILNRVGNGYRNYIYIFKFK